MPRDHVTFRVNTAPITDLMTETGVDDRSEVLRTILSEAMGRRDVMTAVKARLKAKATAL